MVVRILTIVSLLVGCDLLKIINNMKLTFVKLAGDWFVHLPDFPDEVTELVMVDNAHTFLEYLNSFANTGIVTVGAVVPFFKLKPVIVMLSPLLTEYEPFADLLNTDGLEVYAPFNPVSIFVIYGTTSTWRVEVVLKLAGLLLSLMILNR